MEELRKVKCTVSYDGGNYGGYQLQENFVTIQQVLEEALKKVIKRPVRIYASGRTDAGVHARGQVFHFQTPVILPEDRWPLAMNCLLPEDISVLAATYVPDSFHARFDVKEKTYRYCLWNRRIPDVFLRRYSWHIPYALDLEKMREGAQYLIGEHDFTSFCSVKAVVEDKVRKIYDIAIEEQNDGEVWFTFRGKGFLYNMVRIIVGTLVNVGAGKIQPADVRRILEGRERTLAGKTAPAQGLFLWEVKY
ncbi:tRNA pseudouridine(38-40) synthase TruA [Ammoniphilus sp. CFH 90114]|uniref:tRNA pseudouridine(38-40) synthase TruA n=1 Tax=Ammoniphilus sp. CFH 90114 TaxID=2493665 RepID=UPI00100EF508|nr:tRNA pseudouridine(38-40) synthase TruA [Ammoniphilus sp. CFH 90114]RXT05336.1 tRNA pseudouridine(38-40) synthase TruA [Ammoniphilus sp. CFH 90114]